MCLGGKHRVGSISQNFENSPGFPCPSARFPLFAVTTPDTSPLLSLPAPPPKAAALPVAQALPSTGELSLFISLSPSLSPPPSLPAPQFFLKDQEPTWQTQNPQMMGKDKKLCANPEFSWMGIRGGATPSSHTFDTFCPCPRIIQQPKCS